MSALRVRMTLPLARLAQGFEQNWRGRPFDGWDAVIGAEQTGQGITE